MDRILTRRQKGRRRVREVTRGYGKLKKTIQNMISEQMDPDVHALLPTPPVTVFVVPRPSFPGFYQHCLSPHSMEAKKRGFR